MLRARLEPGNVGSWRQHYNAGVPNREEPPKPLFKATLLVKVATTLLAGFSVFALGVAVGTWELPPYSVLKAVWDSRPGVEEVTADGENLYENPDGELLRYAFSRELSHPVLKEPATSLRDVLQFNQAIHTPLEFFFSDTNHVEIIGGRQLQVNDVAPVIVVDFLFNGHERRAYAYGVLQDSYQTSVLMIPGSGQNQSRSIVSGDRNNYHCCLWDALSSYDRFVLIKPNEGLRAVHNGVGRLSEQFIVNYQINTGSSYSAAYTIESVALQQFLGNRSDKLALVGLSQGGKAALVSSLLEPPDVLVVAAGYSVIHHRRALWSGHNQFLIPGMYDFTNPNRITQRIDFPALFTYGRSDIGSYRIDAETGLTCDALQPNRQITCLTHDGGHEFPEQEVLAFLDVATRDE